MRTRTVRHALGARHKHEGTDRPRRTDSVRGAIPGGHGLRGSATAWAEGLARVLVGAGLAGLSACGGGADLAASLALPSQQPSKVSVTPALDLTGLERADWGERLVIEHIALNLDNARLLGADPRIPSGGFDLLAQPRVIAADGRPGSAIDLAFPRQYLSGEDLAVFLRVAPSEILEGASVEVFARLYTTVPTGNAARLSAVDPDGEPAQPGDADGAVDPDGEPANEGGAVDPDGEPANEGGAVDPDGEPANEGGAVDPDGEPANEEGAVDPDGEPARQIDSDDESEGVDPDGEPAHASRSSGLTALRDDALIQRGELGSTSVAFVLRDEAAADMVATLDARSKLDVVIGIPAARWFTPAVIDRLERALMAASLVDEPAATRSGEERTPTRLDGRSGVIEIRRTSVVDADGRSGPMNPATGSFFLTSHQRIERNRLVDGR